MARGNVMEVENYKNIFQIFISNSKETKLPELLESKTQKVKDTYQDYTHKIYNNEMCRDFLFEFDKETLNSYDTLKPYAYKADLTRLCLLHEYGGWYFDISLYPEFKLEFDSTVEGLLIFNKGSNIIENCTLYFKPKNIFLAESIKQLNYNVLRKYYGKNALSPTGPALLRKIYEKLGKDHFVNYKSAIFKNTHPAPPARKLVVEYENKIFVRHKFPQITGLLHLGIKNTNIYDKMWENNDIYNF